MVPDSSIDTLLMYAYSQYGVLHNGVIISIDRDDSNNGANPSVHYKIKLDSSTRIKWKALKTTELKIKNPLLKKAAILVLATAGAPYGLEDKIRQLAKEYLPQNYKVEVEIVD